MKYFLLAVLVVSAVADDADQHPPSSSSQFATISSIPNYIEFHTESYDYPPVPNTFDSAVIDDDDKHKTEQQESETVKGFTGYYFIVLPDGRIQIVNYKSNDHSGYIADVKYKGEAKLIENQQINRYIRPGYRTIITAPTQQAAPVE